MTIRQNKRAEDGQDLPPEHLQRPTTVESGKAVAVLSALSPHLSWLESSDPAEQGKKKLSPRLAKSVASLKQRAATTLQAPKPEQPKPEQLTFEFQMPWMKDSIRISPNEICRMALFTTRRGARKQYFNEQVFVVGDGEATYTGQELRAKNDELVWLQCMFLARNKNLGDDPWIYFTQKEMCEALGWTTGGTNYKQLGDCLLRLKATALLIRSKNIESGDAVSLIGDFKFRQNSAKDKVYAVELSPKIAQWFGCKNSTYLKWKDYLSLPPVARRIYDYGTSHKNPYALKLETMRDLCGSEAKTMTDFRKILARNIALLKQKKLFNNIWLDRNGKTFIDRTNDDKDE